MMNSRRQSRIKVLVLPWLAHGHISPFLELSKQLMKQKFYIYFCSSPVNLSRIKGKLTGNYSHSIQLVELHLPSLPELPPHYHTTNGLPPHLMPTLKMALDMASPSFTNILKTLSPDLLIYDFIQPWAPAAAASLGIPSVQFLSNGAAATAFMIHFVKKPDKEKARQCLEQSSNVILIRSFKEIEERFIDFLSNLNAKTVVPVGPLLQDQLDEEDAETEMVEWLSKKDPASSVFVSFGSEYFLSKEELEEVAYGLELSKVNFIWVVRFPMGDKTRVEEALPEGFLSRVGDKGMVVEGWAPQKKILRHSSIGGFVSHCGWGSVMESMNFGVPIVAMPMHLDQPFNAKLVEAHGVGIEVKRDENGKLQREEIAKVIKEVVVKKCGEIVRQKAREFSENMSKKGDEEIVGVVEKLVQLCGKRN
ncbi:UDP-glucosyltransferase 29 isoform X2 [Vitis vinifera]|uniref:UDP-glucosyltransferase 29 isoform X2 n=1 Tax=Vitis vinifera TaxID=29760 RepID=UPI00053FCA4B|nr:UDP-glucosyltransferase 29 isoform X2 [Vitis vinifera]|eukprot:XP_010658726.1 PREDICTED: beta-D-glucosyl crocetin beta-1,6-glucosyltransferase isoform X2 [Vitis vinifera]